MKVILYMAITVNGMIAKEDDDTSFVSETELESFDAAIKHAGNIIVGRRTYEVMKENNEFNEVDALRGTRVVVVTNGDMLSLLSENHSISTEPKQALYVLENEGFREALVAGGGMLNGSFMQENLLDEIYVDVEPIILGKGIKLFGDKEFEAKLELLGVRKLNSNIIQLHYKILSGK